MNILKETEKYIRNLFASESAKNLLFHSEQHTIDVVNQVNDIAAHYDISEEDVIALNIAAWFHDTGHLYTTPDNHELVGADLAAKWLGEQDQDQQLIEKVKTLILSTKLANEPNSHLEKIMKDADTFHFGTKDFKRTDKLLKEEMRLRKFNNLLLEWDKNKLKLLSGHNFYTDYAKGRLEAGKEKNIQKIKKKSHELANSNASPTILLDQDDKESKSQNALLTKGIQTMLRLTSDNHMMLSNMADNKSNILISVNAIIISLILSVLIRKIEVDTHLTIPTLIFLSTSVITIVLAIIATRPKVTKGIFSREDILNRKTNLLFFGNFYKSTLEDYKWGMRTMMRDPNYLYGGLVDDIYYLGAVLGRKYKLLSWAYSVFMVGIIVSVLAFTIVTLIHSGTDTTGSITVQPGNGNPF
jgi:Family of unknown function (DUF5706)/HD domain